MCASASGAEGQNSLSVVELRKQTEECFPFTGIITHPPENKTPFLCFLTLFPDFFFLFDVINRRFFPKDSTPHYNMHLLM